MVEMSVSMISEQLRLSNLWLAESAASAVDTGWNVFFGTGRRIPATELEYIYGRRLDLFKEYHKKSAHKEQLERSIEEFVRNLKQSEFVVSCIVSGDSVFEYLLFFDGDEGSALGALKTISKQSVSSEEWEAIWNG